MVRDPPSARVMAFAESPDTAFCPPTAYAAAAWTRAAGGAEARATEPLATAARTADSSIPRCWRRRRRCCLARVTRLETDPAAVPSRLPAPAREPPPRQHRREARR